MGRHEPEFWQDIPGYKGKYQVSNCGRVRNTLTGTILNPANKYSVVLYKEHHIARTYTIASLVGMVFIGPLPPGFRYYHKNGLTRDHHARNIGIKPAAKIAAEICNSKKRQIAQIDRFGEITAVYSSLREAERHVPYTRWALSDICNGYAIVQGKKHYRKSVFNADGYAYAWDDEKHVAATLHRMEQELKGEAVIIDTSGYLEEPPKEYIGAPEEWLEACGGGYRMKYG